MRYFSQKTLSSHKIHLFVIQKGGLSFPMQNYFGNYFGRLKYSCWPLLTKEHLFWIQHDLSFQNGVRLYQKRLSSLKGQNEIKSFEVIKVFLLTSTLLIYSSTPFFCMKIVCRNVYIWDITSIARWEKKIKIFNIFMKDKCFHVLLYLEMHLTFDCQQETGNWLTRKQLLCWRSWIT